MSRLRQTLNKVAEVTTGTGAFTPNLTRWLIFVAIFGATYLLAFLLLGVGRGVPGRPAATYDIAQTTHCTQLISLARTKYGPDWKRRLDPRNTECAPQIQQAWEHQWNPRDVPVAPVLQARMIPNQGRPTDGAQKAEAGRALNPETYCLNVISLAKSKYGPDWTRRIDPAAAANCRPQISQ
jgi:hypothetical protein